MDLRKYYKEYRKAEMNKGMPRCDKCEDRINKRISGENRDYCIILDRDVTQSVFGLNSPRVCPKRV